MGASRSRSPESASCMTYCANTALVMDAPYITARVVSGRSGDLDATP